MKSVGEGMAISRSFEEALQSAIRMTGLNQYGIEPHIGFLIFKFFFCKKN